ncbi:MAG TPA: ion transporter [Opitutaceae bacterium]|nr:ion transporter [Opitutaceae bacterium]
MAGKHRHPDTIPAPVKDSPWREKLHEVIFEAETPTGRAFDIAILWAICLSVVAVSLESVASIRAEHGTALRVSEWVFTGLFTVEYVVRLAAVRRPLSYAKSFYGIVDLLAVLPTYASLFVPGAQSLIVVRAFRLLRIFRILKLTQFVGEAHVLRAAIRGSVRKIMIFLITVLMLMLIAGATMYLVEGDKAGFTSIPKSIYWAIVTMTTVGYGDIVPQTVLGQVVASVIMITGYGIIAVPTGIVTVELSAALKNAVSTIACHSCGADGHANDARYCKFCGAKLERGDEPPRPRS